MCCSPALIRPTTLLQHGRFPVNITKLLQTPCFIEHLRWLLLFLFNILHMSQVCIFFKSLSMHLMIVL